MSSNWQNKIRQLEAPAPASAWNNIANKLNDTGADTQYDFVAKLADYSFAPPSTAEENIFLLLDEEDNENFTKRIYDYSETAPADAWDNISGVLDKQKARVIPFKQKNYLRVAAAVAAVVVVSFALIKLTRSENDNIVAASKPVVSPQTSLPQQGGQPNEVIAQVESTTKNASSITQNKTSHSVVSQTTVGKPQAPVYALNSDELQLLPNPAKGKKEKLQNSNGDTPEDIALINTPSYITVTGPDGRPVNVSAKFSSLLEYLMDKNPATQENIDIIIKESAKWKATFAAWREKMTNNNVAPSLSNFMDIIELSEVLENKK